MRGNMQFVAKQQKQELSAAPVAAEVGLHQGASGFAIPCNSLLIVL